MTGKVLVVGAGIAGLSASIALSKLGLNVQTVEKTPQWAPAGAGIMLQANAMAVLESLSLADSVRQHGCVLPGIELRDAKGSLLMGIARGSKPGEIVTIHRAQLHRIMLEASQSVPITLNKTIVRLKTLSNDSIHVYFSDSTEDVFDLVIGADGVHSSVRHLINQEPAQSADRYSGQVCWRMVVPNRFKQASAVEVWGHQTRAGLIPLGYHQLYIFLVKSHIFDRSDQFEHVELNQDDFNSFPFNLAALLQSIDSPSQIIFNPLKDKSIYWGEKNILLIGDAAHAMTPNMGQGAAMALEDVADLVDVIKQHGLAESTRELAARRQQRVSQIQRQSYSLGQLAHIQNKLLQSARNAAFKLTPTSMAANSMAKLYLPGIEVAQRLKTHISSEGTS